MSLFSALSVLRVRRARCRFLLSVFVASLLPAIATQAQTAQFSYAQSTVASVFGALYSVAVDASGNVYAVDNGANTLYKETLNENGSYTQSTIASGFSALYSVAVDASGNVYVDNSGTNTLYKETPNGGSYTQSTVASGFISLSGVAVDASGNVYAADGSANTLYKETPNGGSYTQSTVASGFTHLYSVAVDASGNVYATDQGTKALYKETLNGGSYTQSTVASGFSTLYGVAADASGNVYATDGSGNLYKETLNGGSYTQSTAASGFIALTGVAVDASGNVYVDDNSHTLYRLQTADVNFFSSPVGTATATIPLTFTFTNATAAAIGAPAVLTMGATGLDFTVASGGTCTNGTSFSSGQTCTVNVTFTPKYAGQRMGAVQLTNGSGAVIATALIYGIGTGPQVAFPSNSTVNSTSNLFYNPNGVAVDGAGDVFVVDASNSLIREIEGVGGQVSISSSSTVVQVGSGFKYPGGVAVDGAGDVFVADGGNNAVKEIVAVNGQVSSTSTVITVGSGFSGPQGVALDGAGDVFVADSNNNVVKEIVAVNGQVSSTSTVKTVASGFSMPGGVAVDSSGDVFVVSIMSGSVQEIEAVNGQVSTSSTVKTVGTGYGYSQGVAVDSAGDVYVADPNSNAVKEIVAVNGQVSTSSTVISVGSGFNSPYGVGLDSAGDLFVPDNNTSGRVREFPLATPPSLSFASTGVGSTSGAQTVTLQNIGNVALTFPVPSTGNNPSVAANFILGGTTTCPELDTSSSPGTLASGASCALAVDFAPTSAGSITGSVVVTDDHLNAASPNYTTQSISLSGTGTAAAPGAPTGVTATAGNTQATVSFSAPSSNGGQPITGYTATSSPGGITGTCAVSPCTVTGLANGTAYTFTVTATNSVGTGTASLSSNSVTPKAPQTITFNNPGAQNFGTTPILTATASSGLTVTFSSSTTGVCTITSGGQLTFNTAGTCTINADQAGNSTYATAATVSQSFTVAAGTTTTALSVTAGGSAVTTVGGGTVVTLTATVQSGATAVTPGQVNFCDASAAHCTDIHLLGTAQLTSSGTAVLKLKPGIGSHSYKAVFVGTPSCTTSASSAANLSVTGTYTTTATIAQSGSAGNYTLTATVAGLVNTPTVPTGTVSFLDTTNSGAVLGTASLGAGTLAQGFATQVPYATGTGSEPGSVAVGDFNGDGIPDLAVANYGSSTVAIFLGNGDGTFPAAANYTYSTETTPGTATNPDSIAVGDFNGDGKLDLAVANITSNTVSIFLGNGNGTFAAQVTYATGSGPDSVAVEDFNGDGKLDLAVANGNGGGTVGIFLGKGDGTFNSQVTYGAGSGYPRSVAVGDFNGDGKLDLAVANSTSNTVNVLLGNGDGTFQTQVPYSTQTAAEVTAGTATYPVSVVVGDFNGDGHPDLAVANYDTGTESIFLNSGTGTFPSPANYTYTTGSNSTSVAVGDFNGDGKLDLAVTNDGGSVNVLLGDGTGAFPTQAGYGTGAGSNSPAVGDFNGDGIADLAVPNQNSNNISVLLGQWTETATASASGISPVGPSSASHAVVAHYPGDSAFAGRTSSTTSLTAQPVATTLTLGANPSSSTYGQQVTLTATLSPYTAQGHSTDNEMVTFSNNATSLGTGTLSGGVATLNVTSLPAGTDSLTAKYAGDSNFDNSTTTAVSFSVSKATPTVSVSNLPAGGTYGGSFTPTFSYTGDGTTSVTSNSTSTCTVTSGVVNYVGVGTCSLTASATAGTNYNAVTGTAQTFSVVKATATVTLGSLSQTYTGSALAATATTSPSGLTVDFTYNGSSTAPTTAGSYAVVGTISDANYQGSATGTLVIGKATPTASAWPTASAITYGQTLASSTLSGGTASVAGSFAWTTSTTSPGAGSQSESVTFTPTDTTDYATVTGTVTLTVNKATPTVSAWPSASAITYGQTLASSTLTGGTASVAGSFAWTTATASPGAGSQSESVTFTPTDMSNYTTASASVSLTVNKATATVTLGNLSQTYSGSPVAMIATTNPFGMSVSLTYNGSSTAPTAAGIYTVVATINDANYQGSTTGTLVISKATPTVSVWPAATAITYGQTLASSTLTGGTASVAGSFAWITASTSPGAGTPSESVTFTPTDTADYTTVTGTATLTVNKATPSVSAWPSASGITYGQTLANSTLSGGTASVAGSFAWTTSTISPGAGTQSESVTFMPTDTTDYNSVTGNVSVTVSKASPTVNAWPTASGITYGQTLADSALSGGTASVAGSFAWTTAGTSPGTGTLSESVIFTPADTNDYNIVTGTVTLTVAKATATVTLGGLSQTYTGSARSATATTNPSGLTMDFTYNGSSTAPTAAGSYTVVGTISDANYQGTASGTLVIGQATPTISAWPKASAITYSQTLSSATLTGGTASVAGTFAWTTSTTSPGAGSQSESVTFTPTDMTDYTTVTGSVMLTVTKATPTVSWTTPAAIPYGTALSATQLDASSSVAGSFTYSPAAGALLSAGTQTLSVTFTPTDTADYNSASASVVVSVGDTTLTVSAKNATKIYGTANPLFTGSISGALNGDSFTESFATTATASSNVGAYTIVPNATGANLGNYTVTIQNGTLTVTKAGSAVALTSSTTNANLNASVTLTATVTSATTGTPTGSVEFLDGSTVLGTSALNAQDVATYTVNTLAAGTHPITAVYAGDTNFNESTSAQYEQTVTSPDFSLTANPASLTLKAGQTGEVTFTFTPVGGYTGTVNFACTGLPANASCGFAPSSLTADGSNKQQISQLTITTEGPNTGTVASNDGEDSGNIVASSIFWLPGLLFGCFLLWQRKKLSAPTRRLLGMLIVVAMISGMIGCAFGNPEAPSGAHSVTVTATVAGSANGSGTGASHTASFTLTITQ